MNNRNNVIYIFIIHSKFFYYFAEKANSIISCCGALSLFCNYLKVFGKNFEKKHIRVLSSFFSMPYRILIKCRMIINLFDCFLHNANFCFARDTALYLLFIIGLKLYECKTLASRIWIAFEKDLNIAWKTIYSITVICHINATLQSGMIC